jgi:vacuolar-type H+-ATPase subunit E/Vma4
VGISELLHALDADGERERADLLAAARREADQIAAAASAARERRLRDALEAHRAARQMHADLAVAEAELQQRGAMLAARARMLDRVRAAAAVLAAGYLDGADGDGLLVLVVGEAVRYLGDAPAVLRCRPALAERVRAAAAALPGIRVETDAAAGGGVRAESADGAVVIDCTLPGLLAAVWPALRIEVVRRVEAGVP